jgi:hypothetical protein
MWAMDTEQCGNVVLVVADSNFINLCADPFAYMARLKEKLAERSTEGLTMFTVSGKFGVGNIDDTIGVIPVDDKNKTVFGQTLENVTMLFDKLVTITISANDPFLSMACEVVTNANKPYTKYGYQRK